MSQIYNIYCDESCHLEHDRQKAMVLGAVWSPIGEIKEISKRIREIKLQHGLSKNFEIKWTKISPMKLNFYLNIIDYFFDNDNLHFRCLVIPDKYSLNHKEFGQDHDDWYYKMYFDMLKIILNPYERYRIYLDIKDSKGGEKIKKLHEVLSNNLYDFDRQVINRAQIIRSHEAEIMQITDLLIGAVGYINRGLKSSEAKNIAVNRIKERSGYSLIKTTLYQENKFNIFLWKASKKIC